MPALQHVVFGKVVKGMDVVKNVEKVGSQSGKTAQPVVIADCGQLSWCVPCARELMTPRFSTLTTLTTPRLLLPAQSGSLHGGALGASHALRGTLVHSVSTQSHTTHTPRASPELPRTL
jgi:hypothetical protein